MNCYLNSAKLSFKAHNLYARVHEHVDKNSEILYKTVFILVIQNTAAFFLLNLAQIKSCFFRL